MDRRVIHNFYLHGVQRPGTLRPAKPRFEVSKVGTKKFFSRKKTKRHTIIFKTFKVPN